MVHLRCGFWSLLLAGCTGRHEDTAPVEPASPCGAEERSVDGACVPVDCGSEPWGAPASDEPDALYVDIEAVDGGDGSPEAPLRSVGEALDRIADAHEGGTVRVAAGRYEENLGLKVTMEPLRIEGRCSALVELVGEEDAEEATVSLPSRGDVNSNFALAGLTIAGGFGGIYVPSGQLSLTDVVLSDNLYVGMDVYGEAVVSVDGLRVENPRPFDDGSYGWGLYAFDGGTIQGGDLLVMGASDIGIRASNGATLALEDCTLDPVEDRDPGDPTVASGLWTDRGASASLRDCTVFGEHGVGLLVQEDAMLNLEDVTVFGPGVEGASFVGVFSGLAEFHATRTTVADSAFAGMLLLSSTTTLEEVTVQDTYLGELPELIAEPAGSGIDVEEGSLDAKDLVVTGSAWMGVLLDEVEAHLEDVHIEQVSRPADLDLLDGGGMLVSGGDTVIDGLTISDATARGIAAFGAPMTVDDLTVLRTTPGRTGVGIGVQLEGERSKRSTVVLRGCTFEGNEGSGIRMSKSDLDLSDCTLSTLPIQDGRFGVAVIVDENSDLVASDLLLQDNRAVGFYVGVGSAILTDVAILATARDTDAAMATGIGVATDGVLEATGLVVRSTEGPGLVCGNGAVCACSECTFEDNTFAGVVVTEAELRLEDSTVDGTLADAGAAGVVGVFCFGAAYEPKLRLDGVEVGGSALAAVLLVGPGDVRIVDSTLSGGVDGAASDIHPALDGVVVTGNADGPALRISDTTLAGSLGVGILLDASDATLSGLTWEGNGTDFWQQRCAEVDTQVSCPDDANCEICPADEGGHDLRVELDAFDLYLDDLQFEGE